MRIFILLLLLISFPAMAAELPKTQEPAMCTEKTAGTVKCMETRLCECKFSRGGSITGGVDGYKWDCGINRPSCGAEFDKIETEQKKYDGPSSINTDKSSVNVNQNQ